MSKFKLTWQQRKSLRLKKARELKAGLQKPFTPPASPVEVPPIPNVPILPAAPLQPPVAPLIEKPVDVVPEFVAQMFIVEDLTCGCGKKDKTVFKRFVDKDEVNKYVALCLDCYSNDPHVLYND